MLQRPAPFLTKRHPLISLLEAYSNSLTRIKQSHARLVVSGLAFHPFAASKIVEHLLLLAPSAAHLRYADLVFHHTASPTLFTFNTLIKAHSSSTSFALFRALLRRCDLSPPNGYTFVFLLSACGAKEGSEMGVGEAEQVRGQAVRRGLETSVFVCNAVVQMYAEWAMMEDAKKMFDEMPSRDAFSWNSLIGGHVARGELQAAVDLFHEMPERDVVSWSTIIAGHTQAGCFLEAIELFREMQIHGVAPNEFALTNVLAACAYLVALDQGKWIHVYIDRSRIEKGEGLLASLIDMYAKCGEIESASKVFDHLGGPKLTSRPWNAMLNAFAIHGQSEDAVILFERMKDAKVDPDGVTFVSLLNACSHGNLVEQGRSYFESMKTYCVKPQIEHYGCMVDLLGRTGRLEEAEEVINRIPMVLDAAIWGALLGACRIHGDVERGERVGKLIDGLGSQHVGCHVLLSNIYSGSRRWIDAISVRKRLESTQTTKIPGYSSIELRGVFHRFLVGDRSHPDTKEICNFLGEMLNKLRRNGYVPEEGEALLDVDGEDKETALSVHSEKLAIAFGLMNTEQGTPIRIVKNLRVCRDCHTATKFISKVYVREIIVRDRIRFHHFNHGSCSCKDYW